MSSPQEGGPQTRRILRSGEAAVGVRNRFGFRLTTDEGAWFDKAMPCENAHDRMSAPASDGSIVEPAPLEYDLRHGGHAGLELRGGQPLHAENVLDLVLEVGVVLRRAPKQKEEVARVQ